MASVQQNICSNSRESHPLIALSDERDLWQSFALSIARASYRAGRRAGWYEHKNRTDRRWRQRRPLHIAWGPANAELQVRRWGDGGRDEWVLKGPVRENGSFYGDR